MGAASCGARQYAGTGAASREGQSSSCVSSSLKSSQELSRESIGYCVTKAKIIVFIIGRNIINA
jgi:hypothetical protein